MSKMVVCDQCGKTARHPWRGVPDEDRTAAIAAYYEFIYLRVEASADQDHGDFCSWRCLAEWAMTKTLEGSVGSDER